MKIFLGKNCNKIINKEGNHCLKYLDNNKFKNNNKDIQIMSKYSINHNYKIIKKCVNLLMVINKKSLKLEIIKYLINKINPNFLINKT